MVCGAGLFTACSTEDNPVKGDALMDKLIGKWMLSDLDGTPCPTNLKTVFTFVSPTKAIGSLSDYYTPAWNVRVEADMVYDGDKHLAVVSKDGQYLNVVDCYIASVTQRFLTMSTEWYAYDGENEITHETYLPERYERINVDYKDDIVGVWEGSAVDPMDVNNYGETHRWEYKADGTFVYYSMVDGEWKAEADVLAEYFVDGVLLCTRWKKTADSEEQREWWEIESINNEVMKWKATRVRADGTKYVERFEMRRALIIVV